MTYQKSNILAMFLTLLYSLCSISNANAQCTTGNITSTHSSSSYDILLDPDGDGYITESGAAFTSGTTELAEFELIPNSVNGWLPIQDVSESDSDITPNCGNSDLVQDDNGGDFAFYNIIDPTPGTPTSGDEFILFRFRLAKSPNGNFGYNFLIDTDLNYGGGTDGNSTCGNMGFEREVQFANAGGQKGVSVYDVDGNTTFNSTLCDQCVSVNDVQEACAASSGNCGTSDPQFITFPLPLSYIGVPSNVATSDFYITTATASSGNATSVLGGGNATDMGALDGNNAGCPCTGLTGCALFDCQTDCINTAFVGLPVELIYFSASKYGDNSLLEWATGSEMNNSHFVIEHGTDGTNFSELGIIDGAGDSGEILNYRYEHQTPEAGLNYYRLKQVDFDDHYALSSIEFVSHVSNQNQIAVWPSIANDYINISISNKQNNEASGEVYNLMGKKISHFIIAADENSTRVNINSFQKGHYFVKAKIGNNIQIVRFIKTGN